MSQLQVNENRMSAFDWPTAIITALLSGIGLTLIYSATVPMGEAGAIFLTKQIMWVGLAVLLSAAFLLFDYSILEKWAVWIYVPIVISLIAVWALGKATAGSRRWIEIGFMRFQPSEFAKLAVVIILSKYYSSTTRKVESEILDFLKPIFLILIPVILVLIQPDLGTAVVMLLISGSVVAFAGIGKKTLIWIGGIAAVLVPVALLVGDKLLLAYQKKRILTYLNPDNDPLGAGYHIIQSQIAIGSGGVFGTGFLQGTQNQLMFLPVKHTDFIFSILAEEWGFIGCLALFVLFGILFLKGLAISSKARDDFGALMAFGCTAILFWHFFVNIGLLMGLRPVVGVPLSFISYGGSSLIVSYLCVAVLISVAMRRFSY
jgi:rod shape determining protein RodA